MRPLRAWNVLACLALLTVRAGGALAADNPSIAIDGKAILKKNCSRCHSIEATGESPLKGAPPLRVVYLKYPVEQLEYDFAEGMGSKHQEMPQIQFSSEEVSAILNYLGSITGRLPSQRLPDAIPGETEPP